MKLFVISSKEGWQPLQNSFVTIGGFPYQMQAIAELFNQTTITLLLRSLPAPKGAQKIEGHHIKIFPLPEPQSTDFRRKLALLTWLPSHILNIWRQIRLADAVHAPVPGDVGFIGILLALLQQKPLFIRHCGTWGEPVSRADKLLLALLERIAGGRNVVLATGGADHSPSNRNSNIEWIFSTTLTKAELAHTPVNFLWDGQSPLRLVTVCRLSEAKNVQAIVHALALLRTEYPNLMLDIAGDGEYREQLQLLVKQLHLQNQVFLHGNLSHTEVLKLLARSHVFVFPTKVKEGFPKAVLEALSVGLPVIATGVSVIPHLIRNCGIVLTGTDAQHVAQALNQMIALHHAFPQMSATARERAQEYTLEKWRDIIGEKLEHAWGPLKAEPLQHVITKRVPS